MTHIEDRLLKVARRFSDWLMHRSNLRHYKKELHTEQRLLKEDAFEDDELIYSATARCQCGAGLAYPKDIGPHGAWFCSAVLKNDAHHEQHDPPRPFTVWEVASEKQLSARGATTRPTDHHKAARANAGY